MAGEANTRFAGFDAALQRFMGWIELLLGITLIIMVILNFINVIGRYVFARTVLGIDEVQVFMMVWMTFIGAAAVTLRGEHLRMDALIKLFPDWLMRTLRAIELVLMLVLACFVIWVSASYAQSMYGVISTVGRIPMVIPHGSVAAGYVLIVIILIRHALRGGRA